MQLHYVWDSGLLLQRMKAPDEGAKEWQMRLYEQRLRRQMRGVDPKRVAKGHPVSWSEESLDIARDIVYPAKEGAQLGEEYAERAYPFIDRQLRRAAIRLAATIETSLSPKN
jgi:hypothetical protein